MPVLVDLRLTIPSLVFDIRYATTNNFTGQVLYASSDCFLLEPTAQKLLKAQEALLGHALRIKVFDAFRPLSVQWRLWELVPDERYVANPVTGSRHNRGSAVDVTLVDLEGNELDMPTPFDEFTERAHRSFMDLPAHVHDNRQRLEDTMVSCGFVGLATEWWHFDDCDWEAYPIITLERYDVVYDEI
jgi:D-alanyl-D-alanine dipeptidase